MTRVRRLGPDDWQTVRAVRLAALADAPTAFASAYDREAAFTETEWRGRLTGSAWFIAEADAPIGIVAALAPRDEHAPAGRRDLVAMWVTPDARGRGVAAQLIEAVVAWSRDDGATEVSLGVTDGNERAARVYLKYGFVPTGESLPMPGDASRGTIAIYRLPL